MVTMMWRDPVILVVLLGASLVIADSRLESREEISADQAELEFMETLLRISEQIERNPLLRAEWDKRVREQDKRDLEIPPVNFTCDVSQKSDPPPTSVHQVRPSDINVIAAFGDSITAGNGLGARNPVEVAIENRGESWAIGGDRSLEEQVITLPNILRKFNPRLKGYSQCWGLQGGSRAWFNVAAPGKRATHMFEQAQLLIDLMHKDPRVDYDNDWKLLSLFIGGNDLCPGCNRQNPDQGGEFKANIERALILLRAEMPRTIVNLVSMFDITPLQNFSTGLLCDLLQWGFCECARNWTTLPLMRKWQLEFSEGMADLANDTRFKTDNFTVVWQPQMQDMLPPTDQDTGEYIPGFLSPDCFHPNRIAHQGFAVWLWNTMLVPVGFKETSFDAADTNVPIACPTEEHPYIFTDENSKNITEWPKRK